MVNLQPVQKEEESILHNLIQFYVYEFSKYLPRIKLEMNGLYKPFELEKYWKDNNFHAFFIKHEEELIGFALVQSEKDDTPNIMEQFFLCKKLFHPGLRASAHGCFIIHKYNGKGFGKIAAINLFNMFPGKWMITQIEKNYPAQAFWRGVISKFTNNNFNERYDEDRRSIQEFVVN